MPAYTYARLGFGGVTIVKFFIFFFFEDDIVYDVLQNTQSGTIERVLYTIQCLLNSSSLLRQYHNIILYTPNSNVFNYFAVLSLRHCMYIYIYICALGRSLFWNFQIFRYRATLVFFTLLCSFNENYTLLQQLKTPEGPVLKVFWIRTVLGSRD